VIDIMPKCLEIAGAAYPSKYRGTATVPLEGENLLPSLLKVRQTRDAPLFWEHEGNRAVREGRWKLVSYYNTIREAMERVGTGRRTGRWELYDLEADRTELQDLAGEQPAIVRDLKAKYDHWAQRIGVRDWQDLLHQGGFDEP